jgi:hypothetical protein
MQMQINSFAVFFVSIDNSDLDLHLDLTNTSSIAQYPDYYLTKFGSCLTKLVSLCDSKSALRKSLCQIEKEYISNRHHIGVVGFETGAAIITKYLNKVLVAFNASMSSKNNKLIESLRSFASASNGLSEAELSSFKDFIRIVKDKAEVVDDAAFAAGIAEEAVSKRGRLRKTAAGRASLRGILDSAKVGDGDGDGAAHPLSSVEQRAQATDTEKSFITAYNSLTAAVLRLQSQHQASSLEYAVLLQHKDKIEQARKSLQSLKDVGDTDSVLQQKISTALGVAIKNLQWIETHSPSSVLAASGGGGGKGDDAYHYAENGGAPRADTSSDAAIAVALSENLNLQDVDVASANLQCGGGAAGHKTDDVSDESANAAALRSQREISKIHLANGSNADSITIEVSPDGECGFTATRYALQISGLDDLAGKISRKGFVASVREQIAALRDQSIDLESSAQLLDLLIGIMSNNVELVAAAAKIKQASAQDKLSWLEERVDSWSDDFREWATDLHFAFMAHVHDISFAVYIVDHDDNAKFTPRPDENSGRIGTEKEGRPVVSLLHNSHKLVNPNSASDPNTHFDLLCVSPTDAIISCIRELRFVITQDLSRGIDDSSPSSAAGAAEEKGVMGGGAGKTNDDESKRGSVDHPGDASALVGGGGDGRSLGRAEPVKNATEEIAAELQEINPDKGRVFGVDSRAITTVKVDQTLQALQSAVIKTSASLEKIGKLIAEYVTQIKGKKSDAVLHYFKEEFVDDSVSLDSIKNSQLEIMLKLLSDVQDSKLPSIASSLKEISRTTKNTKDIGCVDAKIKEVDSQCDTLRIELLNAARDFFRRVFALEQQVATVHVPARLVRLPSILRSIVAMPDAVLPGAADKKAKQTKQDLAVCLVDLQELSKECDKYVAAAIKAPKQYEDTIKEAKAELAAKKKNFLEHIDGVNFSEAASALMKLNQGDRVLLARYKAGKCDNINNVIDRTLANIDATDFKGTAEADSVISKIKVTKDQTIAYIEEFHIYSIDIYVMTQELQRYLDIAEGGLNAAVEQALSGKFGDLYEKSIAQCKEYQDALANNQYIAGSKNVPPVGKGELSAKVKANETFQAKATQRLAACKSFQEKVTKLQAIVPSAKASYAQLTPAIKSWTLGSDLSKIEELFSSFVKQVESIDPLLTGAGQAAQQLGDDGEAANHSPIVRSLTASKQILVDILNDCNATLTAFKGFQDSYAAITDDCALESLRKLEINIVTHMRKLTTQQSIFSMAFLDLKSAVDKLITDKVREQTAAGKKGLRSKESAGIRVAREGIKNTREMIESWESSLKNDLDTIRFKITANFNSKEEHISGLADKADAVAMTAENWQKRFVESSEISFDKEDFNEQFAELHASAKSLAAEAKEAERLIGCGESILQKITSRTYSFVKDFKELLSSQQDTHDKASFDDLLKETAAYLNAPDLQKYKDSSLVQKIKAERDVVKTLAELYEQTQTFNNLAQGILNFPGLPLAEDIKAFNEHALGLLHSLSYHQDLHQDPPHGEVFKSILELVMAKLKECAKKIADPNSASSFAAEVISLNQNIESLTEELTAIEEEKNDLIKKQKAFKVGSSEYKAALPNVRAKQEEHNRKEDEINYIVAQVESLGLKDQACKLAVDLLKDASCFVARVQDKLDPLSSPLGEGHDVIELQSGIVKSYTNLRHALQGLINGIDGGKDSEALTAEIRKLYLNHMQQTYTTYARQLLEIIDDASNKADKSFQHKNARNIADAIADVAAAIAELEKFIARVNDFGQELLESVATSADSTETAHNLFAVFAGFSVSLAAFKQIEEELKVKQTRLVRVNAIISPLRDSVIELIAQQTALVRTKLAEHAKAREELKQNYIVSCKASVADLKQSFADCDGAREALLASFKLELDKDENADIKAEEGLVYGIAKLTEKASQHLAVLQKLKDAADFGLVAIDIHKLKVAVQEGASEDGAHATIATMTAKLADIISFLTGDASSMRATHDKDSSYNAEIKEHHSNIFIVLTYAINISLGLVEIKLQEIFAAKNYALSAELNNIFAQMQQAYCLINSNNVDQSEDFASRFANVKNIIEGIIPALTEAKRFVDGDFSSTAAAAQQERFLAQITAALDRLRGLYGHDFTMLEFAASTEESTYKAELRTVGLQLNKIKIANTGIKDLVRAYTAAVAEFNALEIINLPAVQKLQGSIKTSTEDVLAFIESNADKANDQRIKELTAAQAACAQAVSDILVIQSVIDRIEQDLISRQAQHSTEDFNPAVALPAISTELREGKFAPAVAKINDHIQVLQSAVSSYNGLVAYRNKLDAAVKSIAAMDLDNSSLVAYKEFPDKIIAEEKTFLASNALLQPGTPGSLDRFFTNHAKSVSEIMAQALNIHSALNNSIEKIEAKAKSLKGARQVIESINLLSDPSEVAVLQCKSVTAVLAKACLTDIAQFKTDNFCDVKSFAIKYLQDIIARANSVVDSRKLQLIDFGINEIKEELGSMDELSACDSKLGDSNLVRLAFLASHLNTDSQGLLATAKFKRISQSEDGASASSKEIQGSAVSKEIDSLKNHIVAVKSLNQLISNLKARLTRSTVDIGDDDKRLMISAPVRRNGASDLEQKEDGRSEVGGGAAAADNHDPAVVKNSDVPIKELLKTISQQAAKVSQGFTFAPKLAAEARAIQFLVDACLQVLNLREEADAIFYHDAIAAVSVKEFESLIGEISAEIAIACGEELSAEIAIACGEKLDEAASEEDKSARKSALANNKAVKSLLDDANLSMTFYKYYADRVSDVQEQLRLFNAMDVGYDDDVGSTDGNESEGYGSTGSRGYAGRSSESKENRETRHDISDQLTGIEERVRAKVKNTDKSLVETAKKPIQYGEMRKRFLELVDTVEKFSSWVHRGSKGLDKSRKEISKIKKDFESIKVKVAALANIPESEEVEGVAELEKEISDLVLNRIPKYIVFGSKDKVAPLLAGSIASVKQIQVELQNLIPHKLAELAVERRAAGLEKIKATLETFKEGFTDEDSAALFASMDEQIDLCNTFIDENNNAADQVITAQVAAMQDIKTKLHIAVLDLCISEIVKMIYAAPSAESSHQEFTGYLQNAEKFFVKTEDRIKRGVAVLGNDHGKVAQAIKYFENFNLKSLLNVKLPLAQLEVEQVRSNIDKIDSSFEEASLDAAENPIDDLVAHLELRSNFVSTFTPTLDKLPEEHTQRQALTAELTKLYDDFRVRTAELEIKMVHLKLDLLDKKLAGFNFDSEEERIERKAWFKEYLNERRVYLCNDRYKKDCPNAFEPSLHESVSIKLKELAERAGDFGSHTEKFVNNVVGVYLFDHMAEAQRGIPSHVRSFVEHYKLSSSGNHKTSASSVDPKKSFDVVLQNWIVTLNTSYRFSTSKDVVKGNPSSTLLQQVLGSYAFSSVKPSVDSKALTPYELLQRIHDGIPLLQRYAGFVRDLDSKEKAAPQLIKEYFVAYFQYRDESKLLQSIEILNEEYRVLLKKLADDYVQIFELSKLVLEYDYPIAGVTNIEKPAPGEDSSEGQLLRYVSRYGDAFAVDKFKLTYKNNKPLFMADLARERDVAKDADFDAKYDSFINKLFSDFIPLSDGAVDADTMKAVRDAIYACVSSSDQKVAAACVLQIIKGFKTGRDIVRFIENALIKRGYSKEGLALRITQCLSEERGLLRTPYRKEVLDPSLVAKLRDSSLCDFDFCRYDGSVSGVDKRKNKDGSSFSGEASYSSRDYDPSFYQPSFLDILENLFAEQHADLSNKDFDSLCKLRHSLISNLLKSFKPFSGYEVIERYCEVLAAGLNKIDAIELAIDNLFPQQVNFLLTEKLDEITAKVICSNKYPYRESNLYTQDKQQYIDLLKLFDYRLNRLRAQQAQASDQETKKEIGQKLTDISKFAAEFKEKYEKIFAELDSLKVESGGKEKVMSKAAEDLLVRFIDEATNIFKSLIAEEPESIKDNKNADVLARFKTATTKCGLVKKIMHTFGAFTEDGLPNSAAFTQSRKGSENTATKYLALKDRLLSGDIARWISRAKKHVLGIKDAYKTFKDSFLLEDKIYNENELAIFGAMPASDANSASGKAKNSKAGGGRTPVGTPEKKHRPRRASAESVAGGGGAKGANFHGSFDVASSNTGGHGMDSDRRDSAESGGGSERPKSLSVQRWERDGEGEDALNASSSSAGRPSGGASVDDALPLAEFNQSEFINAFNYSGMMALYLVEYVRYISKFIINHKDPDLRSCYSTVQQMHRSISKKKVTGPDAKDFQSMQRKMQELQSQLEKRVAEFQSAKEDGQNYGRNKFINDIMELVALIYNKSTQLEERARGIGLSHYLYAELAYSMAKSAWGAIGWDIEKYGVFSQQSYDAQKTNLAKKITVPNLVVLRTKLTVRTSTGPLAGEMTVARSKAEDYFKAKFTGSFNCVEKIVEYFLQAGGVACAESLVSVFVNGKFAIHDDLIKLRTLLQRLITVWTDRCLIRPTTFSDQSSVGSGSQSENRSQASSIVVYQVGASTFTVLYEHFAMILLAIKNRIIEIFNINFIALERDYNEANSRLRNISCDNEDLCDALQLHFNFVWQKSMKIIRDCQLELSRHSADSVVEDSCQAKLQDIISKANTIAKESAEKRFTILQAQYPVANLTSATPEVKSSAELGIKRMAKIFEVEVRGVLEKIISAEYSTATSADLLFVFLDKMHAYILSINCNAHPALQETVEITSALYTIVKKVAETFISSAVDKKTISSVALFIKSKLGLLLQEYHDDGLTESSESSKLPSHAHAVSGSGSYQDIDMNEALVGTVKVFIKDCNKYLRITNTPGYGHAKTSLFGGGGAAAIAPSQNTSGAVVASTTSANGTGGGSRSGGGGAAAIAPSQNTSGAVVASATSANGTGGGSRSGGGGAAIVQAAAVENPLAVVRLLVARNESSFKEAGFIIDAMLKATDVADQKEYASWIMLLLIINAEAKKAKKELVDTRAAIEPMFAALSKLNLCSLLPASFCSILEIKKLLSLSLSDEAERGVFNGSVLSILKIFKDSSFAAKESGDNSKIDFFAALQKSLVAPVKIIQQEIRKYK